MIYNPTSVSNSKQIHPKQKLAQINEEIMLNWLRTNESKLPLSIYRLAKELRWSFGATRGTVLRLYKKYPEIIHLEQIFDHLQKKGKILVALNKTSSLERTMKIAEHHSTNYSSNPSQYGNNSHNSIIKENVKDIMRFLEKLNELDEKVLQILPDINDNELFEKFLSLEFGLNKMEKENLNTLITKLRELNDVSG